jgi:hypothetical protein
MNNVDWMNKKFTLRRHSRIGEGNYKKTVKIMLEIGHCYSQMVVSYCAIMIFDSL